jgi:uncharacterized iron-regulated membrane protein
MNDIKDNLANATTIAGSGAALMGWNEVLTLVLIVTGIVLNIVRIVTIKKSDK